MKKQKKQIQKSLIPTPKKQDLSKLTGSRVFLRPSGSKITVNCDNKHCLEHAIDSGWVLVE